MKKLIAALILVGIAVVVWWNYRPVPPVYQTGQVLHTDVQSVISSTGTVGAIKTVQVGSQVGGIVIALYADFNSVVKKGQLVARIDPAPFEAQLEQAKAQLDSAKAALAAAKAGITKAQADIASAKQQADGQRAQVKTATAAEGFAKTEFGRATSLAKGEVGAIDDRDEAQATYDLAVSSRQAAEAQVNEADVQISEDQEALTNAQEQVTSATDQQRIAEANVETAQLNVDHTKIESPIDGIVISRDVELGQTVSANFSAPELFQVAQDLSKMQVDDNIDESDVAKLQVGLIATFTVDALPNITFHARIDQIRKNATNIQNVITYDATMPILDPNPRLFPGMTANVRVVTSTRNNVLAVPSGALRFKPSKFEAAKGQQYVFTLDSANNPVAHKVQTGLTDGKNTEITSGDLHDGDALILSQVKK